METFWSLLGATGLLAAAVGGVVGVCFRRMEKRMEAREDARRKYELFQVKMTTASAALGKANAIAIKNGKCNGETSAALKYLESVKHEYREFLAEQGIDHLF